MQKTQFSFERVASFASRNLKFGIGKVGYIGFSIRLHQHGGYIGFSIQEAGGVHRFF